MNTILICYCRLQICELRHIFGGANSYFYGMTLPYILVTSTWNWLIEWIILYVRILAFTANKRTEIFSCDQLHHVSAKNRRFGRLSLFPTSRLFAATEQVNCRAAADHPRMFHCTRSFIYVIFNGAGCQIIELLMKNELEEMWQEVVVIIF
jgi:hypothetical protein